MTSVSETNWAVALVSIAQAIALTVAASSRHRTLIVRPPRLDRAA